MLAVIESSSRKMFWATYPSPLRQRVGMVSTGTAPTEIRPERGVRRPNRRSATVLFPAPDDPTITVRARGGITKESALTTSTIPSG